MVKVEHLIADGFAASLRGMRNPLNSWDRSDSNLSIVTDGQDSKVEYSIGPKDLKLCQRLIKAGTEHSKFLRQINVSMDIIAPFYFWKEADTYKVGTVSNSCSTMHKITSKPIEYEDFSFEEDSRFKENFMPTINQCEYFRKKYIETKDINYWRALIQLLPESYNQKRTITMNYAVIRNIIHQRKNHKLIEWHQLIEAFKKLPYAEELLFYNQD